MITHRGAPSGLSIDILMVEPLPIEAKGLLVSVRRVTTMSPALRSPLSSWLIPSPRYFTVTGTRVVVPSSFRFKTEELPREVVTAL